MIMRGRIAAAILTVGIAGTLYADMTPICSLDIGTQPVVDAYSETNPPDADLSGLCGVSSIDNLGLGPVTRLPEAQVDCGSAAGPEATTVLANDQGSLSLCLYALLGLGLCRSAPWVKKLSFTCVPEWYHDGGPFQIGHSHIIAPNCLCSALVCCFMQPQSVAEDSMLQSDQAAILGLWRTFQFTPRVLGSRGPPSLTHGSFVA
jgi:hypothetical protein